MEEINTEPEFKIGDIVEASSLAPKCMFRGIQYVVINVRLKNHPACSFIPDSESCKTCNKIKECLAINIGNSVLNSKAVQLEGAVGEIDALYLKKAN